MRRPLVSFAAFLFGAGFMALVAAPNAAGLQKGKKNKGKDDDGVVTNWGKPKDFEPGKPARFWVWSDGQTWHFRTTTAKKKHHFTGRIDSVGGKFTDIIGMKGEKRGAVTDYYRYNADKTAILIDFTTDGVVDGIDFKVDANATTVKFTLALDGEKHPRNISVGRAGDHPKDAVFTVPAHPPESKK